MNKWEFIVSLIKHVQISPKRLVKISEKTEQLSENDRLVYSPDALRYKAVFWRKETQKIEMKAGVYHYNNTKNEIALSA